MGGGGGLTEHEISTLISPTTSIWKTSHPKKISARYQKGVSVFLWSSRYSCQILMKTVFYGTSKNSQISKYMKIRPMGAE
jgi:hypothetical protein